MLLGIFVVEALFLGFSFSACKDLAMNSRPPKTAGTLPAFRNGQKTCLAFPCHVLV